MLQGSALISVLNSVVTGMAVAAVRVLMHGSGLYLLCGSGQHVGLLPWPHVCSTYISQQLDKVWYSMVWYGMVWYGMVWYGMVWYGMVWYGMVWYGMVRYGMVWYGMVWYVIVKYSRE